MTTSCRFAGALLMGLLTVLQPAWGAASSDPASPATAETKNHGAGLISLNFTDADIEGVIKAVGDAIGKNILVDPRVKGTMNLTSDKPQTPVEVLATLTAALRMQGYALVEGAGVYRVVPEADAKLQGGPVRVDASGAGGPVEMPPPGDQIVTQVFRLKYESANNLVPVLRPLIAPNNTITAYPANNTLVVTDYSENLRRIARIVNAIDAPLVGDVDVIPIKYGLAIDIAAIINRLTETGNTNADPAIRTIAVPEPRTNSIILKAATVTRASQIRSLVEKLDTPTVQPGNIWVVPLKNAEAAKLAQTLRGIVSADGSAITSSDSQSFSSSGSGGISTGGTSGASTPGTPGALPGGTSGSSLSSTAASPLGGGSTMKTSAAGGSGGSIPAGMIQADPSTNSIIITANERVYRNLRAVIDRLDARRAQIYVESMIVEVSNNNAEEFGVQLQGLLGGGSTQTFLGTNFNAGTPGSNIITLGSQAGNLLNLGATATAATSGVLPSAGTNIGVLHNYNGVMGLSALARAVSNISGVNVLSTPNLLTLDNEEAKIVIATNIPFVTGQYAQTGMTGTINPFTTVDRKDVGLTLRIKPQISEGGLVRLQIYQESSTVDNSTLNNIYGPNYNKRSLESNVLVEDGQIVALGGLLEDSYTDSTEKTPFLGDIPILGALFRYETKARVKTNLMVFLRPYVIRTAEQSDALTNDRYGLMKDMRDNFQPNVRILSNENLMPMPRPDNGQSPFIAPGMTTTQPTAIPLPGSSLPAAPPTEAPAKQP
ncbi:MAG: type II secretion system secretin GspD [Betaproteobacteria bacterium]|nr:type II secretion system secretin GspD [Betaproteobacteria bacterium]